MITIRSFHAQDFEGLVECYQRGFPEGHNRYSLSRLCRFQKETVVVAEDNAKIVGVVIGITNFRQAWMTGMSVLPDVKYRFGTVSLRLLTALGDRFIDLGFREAFGTTNRGAMIGIALSCGAQLVSEDPNFYWDGKAKLVYRAESQALARLRMLIPPFAL